MLYYVMLYYMIFILCYTILYYGILNYMLCYSMIYVIVLCYLCIITSLPPSLRNAQENHQIVEGCSCSQMVMCGFSKTNSGGSGPTGWPVYVPTVRWICSPCNPMGFWTNQLPGITSDPLTSRCQVVHARQRLRVVFPQPDKYGERWQPSHSDEDHWLGIFPGTRGMVRETMREI